MLEENSNLETVDNMDETTFVGAIYFHSTGTQRGVSLDWSVSHALTDEQMDQLPAAYQLLHRTWRQLMMQASPQADNLPVAAVPQTEDNSDKGHDAQ